MPMGKAPLNFWTMMIALAALVVSIIGLLLVVMNDGIAKAEKNEQRICRLEGSAKVGECGR